MHEGHPFLARLAVCGLCAWTLILLHNVYDLSSFAAQSSPVLARAGQAGVLSQAFEQAGREFQVPMELLEAICYMEGRLSNNGGSPSVDHGYGCMHLTQNSRSNQLDLAARLLNINADQFKLDMPTNIRGGAALLRVDALRLSSTRRLPDDLSGWYGAVAEYSNAATHESSLLYADAVYTFLAQGFSAQAEDGEMITLAPQRVLPNVTSATSVKGTRALPSGCKLDHDVDYPQAVDCLVPAQVYDCNQTPQKAPCTYESAQRPADYAIDQIVIHDIEGTAQQSLRVFQNARTAASVHYIIDSDGTIYQVVREKDIAYHAGNYWYNRHSIGIEHAGVDATGYLWYNASEYLASAKLAAYLLKKYHLPLSHDRLVSHGTIPSPSATSLPNHVDPGPYWLWDYYIKLIHAQGVSYPGEATTSNIFTLRPASDRRPLGSHGRESRANFSFFFLYNGPSTASERIPQAGNGHDITDVSANVEPGVSYYALAKVVDPAGSGDTLYKIWYGVVNHPTSAKRFAHARLAWLAVPRGAAGRGEGSPIVLHAASGQTPLIYGQPTTDSKYILGDAPDGAVFVSAYTVNEDATDTSAQVPPKSPGDTTGPGDPGNASPTPQNNLMANSLLNRRRKADDTGMLWYEINYNHRQAWIPASETAVATSAGYP